MNAPFRYSPLYIPLAIFSFIRSWFFVILLLAINYPSRGTLWMIAASLFTLFFILTIVHALLFWKNTTFELKTDELILKKGAFEKEIRSISYHKIQNIKKKTSFAHKILGLTSLTLETGASGSEGAIELEAITKNEAIRIEKNIKEKIAQQQNKSVVLGPLPIPDKWTEQIQQVQQSKTESPIIFSPTIKETLRAALVSLSFISLIPLLIAFYYKVNDWIEIEQWLGGWMQSLSANWIIILPLLLIFFTISYAVGLITTYLKYGKFNISHDQQSIYIERGILSEQTFSIPKKKVQGIKIKQNLLKRIFDLSEVELVSVGSITENMEEINSLYPYATTQQSRSFIQQLLPAFDRVPTLHALPKQALWMKLIRIPWFALIIWAIAIFREWALWIPIVITLLTYIGRVFDYLFTRFAIEDDTLFFKKGFWSTETFITKRELVIEIAVKQNFFQRQFGLSSILTTNRAKPVLVNEIKDIPQQFSTHFIKWYHARDVEIIKNGLDKKNSN